MKEGDRKDVREDDGQSDTYTQAAAAERYIQLFKDDTLTSRTRTTGIRTRARVGLIRHVGVGLMVGLMMRWGYMKVGGLRGTAR